MLLRLRLRLLTLLPLLGLGLGGFLLLAILPLRGMPLGDAAPGGLRMPPSPPPDALFPPPFAFPFFPFLSKLNALREPPRRRRRRSAYS